MLLVSLILLTHWHCPVHALAFMTNTLFKNNVGIRFCVLPITLPPQFFFWCLFNDLHWWNVSIYGTHKILLFLSNNVAVMFGRLFECTHCCVDHHAILILVLGMDKLTCSWSLSCHRMCITITSDSFPFSIVF